MGKFDAIYFGEDENNLGTGQFDPNAFDRSFHMVHMIQILTGNKTESVGVEILPLLNLN